LLLSPLSTINLTYPSQPNKHTNLSPPGPNATTFIVPGECFPTRYRSTSHGISAASGKIGSIIAQAAIAPLRVRGATKTVSSPWLNHVLQIYAAFMFAGIFTTLCIPETKRISLEVLAGEDVDSGGATPVGETASEEARKATANVDNRSL
jgi:PHS family inorganic phosphate transporter-like MFS transporter